MVNQERENATWDEAGNEYGSAGIVLVVGAGVSMGSSLPSWSELICRLAESAGSDGPSLVSEMTKRGYSTAAIAGVVKSLVGPGPEFLELVREQLYRDFPFFRRGEFSKSELVDFGKRNSTLRAVGAMCAQRGTDNNFSPNRRIHAVVDFNLDALLRVYTAYRYKTHILRTVERAAATASPIRINVYHIHGFLQFELDKIGDPESENDSIVLAEYEYYDFFGRPFGMFSYTMLHLLREHACMFVGLSMTDENLRRLLHYSYSERVSSYMAERVRADKAQRKSRRHFAVLSHSSNGRLDRAIEEALANLGVKVAWVSDYSEIPERLGQIYARSGEIWQHVY